MKLGSKSDVFHQEGQAWFVPELFFTLSITKLKLFREECESSIDFFTIELKLIVAQYVTGFAPVVSQVMSLLW